MRENPTLYEMALAENKQLRTENAALREVLLECADAIKEHEIKQHYWQRIETAERQARAALAKATK